MDELTQKFLSEVMATLQKFKEEVSDNKKLLEEMTTAIGKLAEVVSDNQRLCQDIVRDSQQYHEALSRENQQYHENLLREMHENYAELVRTNQKRHEDVLHEMRTSHVSDQQDSHKQYQELTRTVQKREDEIREANKNDNVREGKRRRHDAYFLTLLTLITVCLSIGVTSFWSLVEKKVELRGIQLTRSNDEAANIRYVVSKQFSARDNLMDAIVTMRTLRDEGQQQCRGGEYVGPDPVAYRQRLFTADFNLIGAADKTNGVFHSQNIQDKVSSFLHLVNVDQQGVCAKNAVTDQKLMLLQTEINTLIVEEIKSLEKKADDTLDNKDSKEKK